MRSVSTLSPIERLRGLVAPQRPSVDKHAVSKHGHGEISVGAPDAGGGSAERVLPPRHITPVLCGPVAECPQRLDEGRGVHLHLATLCFLPHVLLVRLRPGPLQALGGQPRFHLAHAGAEVGVVLLQTGHDPLHAIPRALAACLHSPAQPRIFPLEAGYLLPLLPHRGPGTAGGSGELRGAVLSGNAACQRTARPYVPPPASTGDAAAQCRIPIWRRRLWAALKGVPAASACDARRRGR